MKPKDRPTSLMMIAGAIAVSGIIWLATGFLNKAVMSATSVTTGIELVYLPAGFRLLIILIFGAWGAAGIFLTNPLLFLSFFGAASPLEIIVNSAIGAFVPLLAVRACARFCGIDPSLARLRPVHLPILALAVSIATPLMFNLQFAAFGREAGHAFIENVAAMSFGDFLGCFLVIAVARLLIAAYRAAT